MMELNYFRKVFCLGGAHFPSARKALLKRGWIEVSLKSRSAMGGMGKHAKLMPYRTSLAASLTTGPSGSGGSHIGGTGPSGTKLEVALHFHGNLFVALSHKIHAQFGMIFYKPFPGL